MQKGHAMAFHTKLTQFTSSDGCAWNLRDKRDIRIYIEITNDEVHVFFFTGFPILTRKIYKQNIMYENNTKPKIVSMWFYFSVFFFLENDIIQDHPSHDVWKFTLGQP